MCCVVVDLVEGIPACFILESAVEWGSSRWHALGLKIYSGNIDKVTKLAADKPALEDKLEAIIAVRISSVGAKTAAEEVLRACKSIRYPIYCDVMKGAKELQSAAQGSAYNLL